MLLLKDYLLKDSDNRFGMLFAIDTVPMVAIFEYGGKDQDGIRTFFMDSVRNSYVYSIEEADEKIETWEKDHEKFDSCDHV